MIIAMVFGGDSPAVLGLIPSMLSDSDPRKAREQLDENYSFAGGWRPQKEFEHVGNYALKYPGDPSMNPLAAIKVRDEVVLIYPYSYVAIFQKTGAFEVARMD